jgi:DoxX-like protein
MTGLLPPPIWLIRTAVAAVWLYEGLWCKLLRGEPRQFQIVEAVPRFGSRGAVLFLKALGVAEVGMAAWALSGVAPIACAMAQTLLLVTLNTGGLFWARRLIHDPAGMVIKNFAFLVLAWISASLAGPA